MDLPNMLNGLDLFSGYGGITLALSEWVRPVAYCEADRFAQAVLLSRMADGQLPEAPIWDDVRTLPVDDIPPVDAIYGGFPCQDISVAGAGAGLDGERSGLFFEIVRLSREIRPAFVFLENVPAIAVRGLERVGGEFAALGYDCRWNLLRASDVGAPHRRERWFMLAHLPDALDDRYGQSVQSKPKRGSGEESDVGGDGSSRPLADAKCERLERLTSSDGAKRSLEVKPGNDADGCGVGHADIPGLEVWLEGESGERKTPLGASWWESEPPLGRVVNGCANRVDRIKSLGNGVVPAQAREAFKRLMGIT